MDGNQSLREEMLRKLDLAPQHKPALVVRAKDHTMWLVGNELVPIRWMPSHHIIGAVERLKAHEEPLFKGLDKVEYLEVFRRELQRRDIAAHKILNNFLKYREYERSYKNRKKDIKSISKKHGRNVSVAA